MACHETIGDTAMTDIEKLMEWLTIRLLLMLLLH